MVVQSKENLKMRNNIVISRVNLIAFFLLKISFEYFYKIKIKIAYHFDMKDAMPYCPYNPYSDTGFCPIRLIDELKPDKFTIYLTYEDQTCISRAESGSSLVQSSFFVLVQLRQIRAHIVEILKIRRILNRLKMLKLEWDKFIKK